MTAKFNTTNDGRLVVTMPCGAPPGPKRDLRFSVLQRTVRAAEQLLAHADEVVCLANFGDRRTKDWLREQPFNPRVVLTHRRFTNPEATEYLMRTAVDQLGATHILHLEDDWYLDASWKFRGVDGQTPPLAWLETAVWIFDHYQDVGQVRLRRVDDYEPESYHWVTGAPVVRERQSDGAIQDYELSNVHCTYNPALWRAEAAMQSFPVGAGVYRDEQASMRCYDAAGWRSAALLPGVFMHRDNGCSVEEGLR